MGYTETAWGCIAHMRITTCSGTVEAPVKLRPAEAWERARNGLAVGFDGLPYPACNDDDRLVYVLPGGLEIAGMKRPARCGPAKGGRSDKLEAEC